MPLNRYTKRGKQIRQMIGPQPKLQVCADGDRVALNFGYFVLRVSPDEAEALVMALSGAVDEARAHASAGTPPA